MEAMSAGVSIIAILGFIITLFKIALSTDRRITKLEERVSDLKDVPQRLSSLEATASSLEARVSGLESIPERLSKMEGSFNTFITLLLNDSMSRHPDLFELQRSFRLREPGHELLPPELKMEIQEIAELKERKGLPASAEIILTRIGMQRFAEVARDKGVPIGALVSAAAAYAEEILGP